MNIITIELVSLDINKFLHNKMFWILQISIIQNFNLPVSSFLFLKLNILKSEKEKEGHFSVDFLLRYLFHDFKQCTVA